MELIKIVEDKNFEILRIFCLHKFQIYDALIFVFIVNDKP